jgi:N-acetylneuraminic acid mutarotase
VAAPIAGVHGGVLLAAGGANFPDRPPWEGGVKRTYDEIYALVPGESAWRTVGRLPVPRAYAAVVNVPEGVLAIGGENAAGVFQDALLFSWNGREASIQPAPALPVALASPVAAVLGRKVYLAGGYASGSPRVSTDGFYCLDLDDLAAGWQKLLSWPGPSRALAVIAALNGAIYLVSGLEMLAGADGQPKISYLKDAYRYRPGQGWEKLPDLPWSAIAAPSPAPVTSAPDRVFIFGGVDGRQVGKVPRDKRVPEDILYFDVARHEWRLWKETWPEPMVSAPCVPNGNEWVFVSGETMAGHRTTAVVGWRPL